MKVSMKNVFLVAAALISLTLSSVNGATFVVQDAPNLQDEIDKEMDPLSTVTVTGVGREATAAEFGDDASLEGAGVFELWVNSPTPIDITNISLEVDVVTGSFFNHPSAQDNGEPNSAFVAVFPSMAADSYVRTPISTAPPGTLDALGPTTRYRVFDTTDDQVTSFKFAQITIKPGSDPEAFVHGAIAFADGTGGHRNAFRVRVGVVPEPASMGLVLSACLGCLGLVRRRRKA